MASIIAHAALILAGAVPPLTAQEASPLPRANRSPESGKRQPGDGEGLEKLPGPG